MCTPYTNAAATLEARAEAMLAEADAIIARQNSFGETLAPDIYRACQRHRARSFATSVDTPPAAPHQPVNDPTLHELHDVWKSDFP